MRRPNQRFPITSNVVFATNAIAPMATIPTAPAFAAVLDAGSFIISIPFSSKPPLPFF